MNNKSKVIGISLLIIIIFVFLFGEKIISAEEINNGIDDGSLKDILGSEYTEGIELTNTHDANTNYAKLEWKLKENKGDWTYRVYQRTEGESEFKTVSSKYNKQVKVLNIYPTGSNGAGDNPMSSPITFTSQIDGKQYTLPKSASLKQWMEEANEEEAKGYGQGLISVDAVSLTDYNNEPNTYLKDEDGKYKYDVLMFGTWDGNGHEDLNAKSASATQSYIDTGRGVLFGHDTICYARPFFAKLQANVNMKVSSDIPYLGSSTVVVSKNGYITKYPYNIEERNLSIPLSHTTGEYAYGDIWLKYVPPFNSTYSGPDYGNNNYFITTWNNCAVTRTGHSNGAATADEQKILANVLFYLGQVTTEPSAMAYTAEDLTAPAALEISIDGTEGSNYKMTLIGRDNGTTYEHYVMGIDNSTGEKIYSNKTTTTVTSGIKGYSWVIDASATTIPDDNIEDLPKINLNMAGHYLHIKAIDNAGNIGETKHVLLPKIYNGHINLTSSHREGTNYADLRWNAPNGNPGWTYRLYEKKLGETSFHTVSTKYNKVVKVLNIYPRPGFNQLAGWMRNYGKGLIQVDQVELSTFNNNPAIYLKNPDGTYKYDVLMFGSCDCNGYGGSTGDLSYNASVETERFIDTGRGVLFGHDTVCLDGNAYHRNFARLAGYCNLSVHRWWWC